MLGATTAPSFGPLTSSELDELVKILKEYEPTLVKKNSREIGTFKHHKDLIPEGETDLEVRSRTQENLQSRDKYAGDNMGVEMEVEREAEAGPQGELRSIKLGSSHFKKGFKIVNKGDHIVIKHHGFFVQTARTITGTSLEELKEKIKVFDF